MNWSTLQKKLYTFNYYGINAHGQPVNGEVTAPSLALAKADLRHQGIVIQKIQKKSKSLFASVNKKVTQQEITLFSRQLATMLSAGIPLVQALTLIAQSQDNDNAKQLIIRLKTRVEAGSSFAKACGEQPKYFNALFCSLVCAGEISGALDTMLDNTVVYRERVESIKNKVKKALIYPTMMLITALLVTTGMLAFVIPQFKVFFSMAETDLPMFTRFVIYLSQILQNYWSLFAVFVLLSTCAFLIAKKKSSKMAYLIDKICLQLPITGKILKKAAIARFSRTLAITYAAGLPLVEALKCVAGATGNLLFTQAAHELSEKISAGQSMTLAMREQQTIFPTMVTQMIAVGEESGSLEKMLIKVASFYDDEVNNAVDGLNRVFEPLMTIILSILIGGILIAMYLPIFKLGSIV